MPHRQKNWIAVLAAFLAFCSPALLAADAGAPATSQVNESLQQQLQALQDSLQSPNTKDAQKTVVTTTKVSVSTPASTSTLIEEKQGSATEAAAPTAATAALSSEATDANGTNATNPGALAATSLGASAPSGGEMEGNDLRTQAFGKMITNTLPLSPSQIRMLRNMYDATQQAAVTYPGVPPRPTASSLAVNLSPGATPPVVRLGAGFVTSLVFVDATGAPWPIDSYSLGNPTAFNIQWDRKSNILLIQAISAHRIGNLAVLLKGLNTPVMVDLNPGQAAMDVRVDLRIPGFGPQAKPTFDTLPGSESPVLLALLDGIPPPGAKNLKSSACENCAWLVDKKMYLRTQFSVISPAWISTMSSADGTHVYEMQTTPLVLASYNGKTIKMKIEGF